MASTTTQVKRFEQRVKQEVEKRKKLYAKQLEHTRLREQALQKRATETEEERKERHTATATFYSVLFINDIVGNVVVDFVAAARQDAELYRLTDKRNIEQVESARQAYEQRLQKVAKYYGYYLYDMMDYVEERTRQDVFFYRNSIQLQFTRNKLPKYSLLALLETARSLAWYACQLCDKRIQSIGAYEDLTFNLGRCRITELHNKLTQLADNWYKRYCPKGVTISLYKDMNAANGVQIIANKVESGDMIAAAIEFADSNVKEEKEDEL